MRNEFHQPKLIIFDCDGVLVDSETIFNQVLIEDLAEHGLALTVEQSMALFVGGSMSSVQSAVQKRGIHLSDDWIELLYGKVKARLEQGVDAVEGIPELLSELSHMGQQFCVASNGPVDKMHITLGQTGLLPFFDKALFSAYEVNSWKPEPGLFLHAARQFSCTPEQCVVIEDSRNGTLAARNAEMPCLGYAPTGEDQTLRENNAVPFKSMNEVTSLLGLI